MKRFFFFAPVLLAVLLSTCSSNPKTTVSEDGIGQTVSVAGGAYTDISPVELQAMMENEDFVFVNVHIPFEGDIPNTDLSIPFDEIAQNLDQLPADKDVKIVLYCSSGRMSAIASKTLVELGYTNVWNLAGGFKAWKAAGFPMK